MSTTSSTLLIKPLSLHQIHKSPRPCMSTTRRNLLLTSTLAIITLSQQQQPSKAQDIPLFGLRKSIKKAEQEAEVIVKEAEKEFEDAEKSVEREVVKTAENVSFGGLAQAGVVVGAEVVGVLVASSVVNGILGPEGLES